MAWRISIRDQTIEDALKSFEKAVEFLEKDVQYDDGRCGIVTGYVLIGNSYRELNRVTEAESAYKTALSRATSQKQSSDTPCHRRSLRSNGKPAHDECLKRSRS